MKQQTDNIKFYLTINKQKIRNFNTLKKNYMV